jgi:tetratricopeptide (TPR) repeat protein
MERIDHIREMILDEPTDPFLHYALGLELVKKQHYQEAMAAFQKVITLDENYIAAYYQLGLVFIEIDIVDVARSYIEKGISKAIEKKDLKSRSELQELLEGIE